MVDNPELSGANSEANKKVSDPKVAVQPIKSDSEPVGGVHLGAMSSVDLDADSFAALVDSEVGRALKAPAPREIQNVAVQNAATLLRTNVLTNISGYATTRATVVGQLDTILRRQGVKLAGNAENRRITANSLILERMTTAGFQAAEKHQTRLLALAQSGVDFQRTVASTYMRQSLVLNYHQLYSTKNLITMTKAFAEMVENKLEAIKINTKLPDNEKSGILHKLKTAIVKEAISQAGKYAVSKGTEIGKKHVLPAVADYLSADKRPDTGVAARVSGMASHAGAFVRSTKLGSMVSSRAKSTAASHTGTDLCFKSQALDNTSPDHYQIGDRLLPDDDQGDRQRVSDKISAVSRNGTTLLKDNGAELIVLGKQFLIQVYSEQLDNVGRKAPILCYGVFGHKDDAHTIIKAIHGFAANIGRTVNPTHIGVIENRLSRLTSSFGVFGSVAGHIRDRVGKFADKHNIAARLHPDNIWQQTSTHRQAVANLLRNVVSPGAQPPTAATGPTPTHPAAMHQQPGAASAMGGGNNASASIATSGGISHQLTAMQNVLETFDSAYQKKTDLTNELLGKIENHLALSGAGGNGPRATTNRSGTQTPFGRRGVAAGATTAQSSTASTPQSAYAPTVPTRSTKSSTIPTATSAPGASTPSAVRPGSYADHIRRLKAEHSASVEARNVASGGKLGGLGALAGLGGGPKKPDDDKNNQSWIGGLIEQAKEGAEQAAGFFPVDALLGGTWAAWRARRKLKMMKTGAGLMADGVKHRMGGGTATNLGEGVEGLAKSFGFKNAEEAAQHAAGHVKGKSAEDLARAFGFKNAEEAAAHVSSTATRVAASAGATTAKTTAEKVAESAGTKAAEVGVEDGVKLAAKDGVKFGLKKIPLIGIAAGATFATQRAFQGDWLGAAGELTSGIASMLPGYGTAASVGIDGLLALRDLKKATDVQQSNSILSASGRALLLPRMRTYGIIGSQLTTMQALERRVYDAKFVNVNHGLQLGEFMTFAEEFGFKTKDKRAIAYFEQWLNGRMFQLLNIYVRILRRYKYTLDNEAAIKPKDVNKILAEYSKLAEPIVKTYQKYAPTRAAYNAFIGETKTPPGGVLPSMPTAPPQAAIPENPATPVSLPGVSAGGLGSDTAIGWHAAARARNDNAPGAAAPTRSGNTQTGAVLPGVSAAGMSGVPSAPGVSGGASLPGSGNGYTVTAGDSPYSTRSTPGGPGSAGLGMDLAPGGAPTTAAASAPVPVPSAPPSISFTNDTSLPTASPTTHVSNVEKLGYTRGGNSVATPPGVPSAPATVNAAHAAPGAAPPQVASSSTLPKGKVGSGQCVDLVKAATGLGHTSSWSKGDAVLGNPDLKPGTAIACFDGDGKYGNHTNGTSHAAIYLGPSLTKPGGIRVYDQWAGHPAQERDIGPTSKTMVDNASSYSVIKTPAGTPAVAAGVAVSAPSTAPVQVASAGGPPGVAAHTNMFQTPPQAPVGPGGDKPTSNMFQTPPQPANTNVAGAGSAPNMFVKGGAQPTAPGAASPGKVAAGGPPSQLDHLKQAMDDQGIKDPQMRAGIAAIAGGEGGFKPHSEDSYAHTAPDRLRKIFPSTLGKMTDAQLVQLRSNDKSFFNTVYGGKNGNKSADDGYNFRGRGDFQLTGKANYEKYGKAAGVDLVANPDLVNDPVISAKIAVAYMKDRYKGGGFAGMEKAVNPGATPGMNAQKDALYAKFLANGEMTKPASQTQVASAAAPTEAGPGATPTASVESNIPAYTGPTAPGAEPPVPDNMKPPAGTGAAIDNLEKRAALFDKAFPDAANTNTPPSYTPGSYTSPTAPGAAAPSTPQTTMTGDMDTGSSPTNSPTPPTATPTSPPPPPPTVVPPQTRTPIGAAPGTTQSPQQNSPSAPPSNTPDQSVVSPIRNSVDTATTITQTAAQHHRHRREMAQQQQLPPQAMPPQVHPDLLAHSKFTAEAMSRMIPALHGIHGTLRDMHSHMQDVHGDKGIFADMSANINKVAQAAPGGNTIFAPTIAPPPKPPQDNKGDDLGLDVSKKREKRYAV